MPMLHSPHNYQLKFWPSTKQGTRGNLTMSSFRYGKLGSSPPTLLGAWIKACGLFHTHSPSNFFNQSKQFHLRDVVNKIKIPVFVGDAEYEVFFRGQPKQLKDALGDKATLHSFTGVAGYHCQTSAVQELTRTIFAWLNKTMNKTMSKTIDEC
ncbi:hypothetical protein F5884DRAFT_851224 [Xylogone sp. PMI_703]|nr:hypothetical protein F5884DRAFT_851224 [Xylogone sp. PMI_703]